MKIRIKGNSVRYRLTKSDVEQLWRDGHLAEDTQFISKPFVYAIETSGEDRMTADFVGDKIVIYLPKEKIERLYKSDIVGFNEEYGTMRLLVEKDFVCLDNTEEDQSDNYANPNAKC